jgi:hypothetical protein
MGMLPIRTCRCAIEIPKQLEELVLAEANLEKDAFEAFQRGDYPQCVELMTKVVDRQKNHWKARLFLAMAHYSTGNIYTGAIHFRYLEKHCPDEDVKVKARTALMALEQDR